MVYIPLYYSGFTECLTWAERERPRARGGAPKDVWAREFMENLWGLNQHFPHILSILSTHFHNKRPIPRNCQLIINNLAMFLPTIPHCSTIYQLSSHYNTNILFSFPHLVNAQIVCGENVGTMWEKPGKDVDTYLFLILLPNH